ELRAQRNFSGSRFSPWPSHTSVSEQETARPLLTPGEILQLAPNDELVLVSGNPPIRAKKLRYFADRNFLSRVRTPPTPAAGDDTDAPPRRPDVWSGLVRGRHPAPEKRWSALMAPERGRTAELDAYGDPARDRSGAGPIDRDPSNTHSSARERTPD